MSIKLAKDCFSENLRLFGDAKSQPEKHNLYVGLFNMAKELEDISRELSRIKQRG